MQSVFSQSNTNKLDLNKSESHADKCIQELFGNELAYFKSIDPQRITFFKNVVQNRVSLLKENNTTNDKYPKLSSIVLFDKYNSNIKHEAVFDASTFNVIKYKINFFSNETQVIRIDNTDYLLVISPNKN